MATDPESQRPAPRRRRAPAASVLLALGLVSCDTGAVPRPTLPQVTQASEALHGGGERYRAHRACASTAKSIDDLVSCMRDAGWDFVTRGPADPEAECWRARDAREIDRITPLCFLRTAEHAGGATGRP